MYVDAEYIVTRSSDDETFIKGDRVRLTGDGCIMNLSAGGWVGSEIIKEATAGWKIEISRRWLDESIFKARDALQRLNVVSRKHKYYHYVIKYKQEGV